MNLHTTDNFYHVYLSYGQNEITIKDKLIATFKSQDDAFEYAEKICDKYISAGFLVCIQIKLNDEYFYIM